MKYDSMRAFEKHLESASPHQFSPFYLILSKDPLEVREAAANLLQALLPSPQEREFSLTTLEGAQLASDTFLADLYSPSFLTSKRVFFIQQAEKIKKPLLESLEKYLLRIHSTPCLILTASSWQKQTSFYQAAEKAGIILELAEPKPWEKEKRLVEWVSKQFTAARKIASYPICQAFVKQTGLDAALLAQEMDKLLCYVGDRKELTMQDIAKSCLHQPFETIWQLIEALFRFDAATAIRLSRSFLAEGQPLLPLLRQIRTQFQTQLQVCSRLLQGAAAQDITQEFPYMKGAILERTLQTAQNYGLEGCRKGLLAIDAAEMRTKNSSIDDLLLIELLMVELTHV